MRRMRHPRKSGYGHAALGATIDGMTVVL